MSVSGLALFEGVEGHCALALESLLVVVSGPALWSVGVGPMFGAVEGCWYRGQHCVGGL